MLEQLFGSKTRIRILEIFFSDFEKKYSLGMLRALLKIESRELEKEIRILVDLEALFSEKGAEKKEILLSLNEHFFVFAELRNLVNKSKLFLQRDFVKNVLTFENLKLFLLTGIFSGIREITQTDMLLVGRVHRIKFLSMFRKLEKQFGSELYFTIFSEEEYFYRLSAADHFLYSIFESKHTLIKNTLENIK